MGNLNAQTLAHLATRQLLPTKLPQAIWNVQVHAGPTRARITFVQMLDATSFIWLFKNGVQIAGAGAVPWVSGHFGVTFTDLPQNTTLEFRIDAVDPRPKPDQLPGGIVSYQGLFDTGSRTATVTLRWLKEVQGEGEITYVTKLYDWDGSSGVSIHQAGAEGQLQYGRGHMDPDGSPIGDAFGPPIPLYPAPDAIAIYTYAVVDESSIWPWGGTGFVGMKLPDTFPNDAPNHISGSGYSTMSAQTIVTLPQAEGSFDIPFELFSGPWDYAFQINGTISGSVTKFVHVKDFSLPHSGQNKMAAAIPASPHALVAAGSETLEFHLAADGRICRPRVGRKSRNVLESIGDLKANWFIAAGRDDGQSDIVAVDPQGTVFHGLAGREGTPSWQSLDQTLATEPAALRAPDAALHLFGVDPAGTLVHTRIAGDRHVRWDRWDDGFTGRVFCACDDKGDGWIFASRHGRVSQAQVRFGESEMNSPVWEEVRAPFKGPVLTTAVDGAIVALGVDTEQVFWVTSWYGGRWGPQWERVGTLQELLIGSE